jgi:hypothetical protein
MHEKSQPSAATSDKNLYNTCIQIHIRSSLAIKCMNKVIQHMQCILFISRVSVFGFVYICAGEACDFILWLVGLENAKLHSLRRHQSVVLLFFLFYNLARGMQQLYIHKIYIFPYGFPQQAFHTVNIESAPHIPTAVEN